MFYAPFNNSIQIQFNFIRQISIYTPSANINFNSEQIWQKKQENVQTLFTYKRFDKTDNSFHDHILQPRTMLTGIKSCCNIIPYVFITKIKFNNILVLPQHFFIKLR